MMTEGQKSAKYGPIVGRVASKSDPDKIYDIRDKRGTLSCNCKGFIFNKRCKHVDGWERNANWAFTPKPQPLVDPLIALIEKRLNGEIGVSKWHGKLAGLIALDVRALLEQPAPVAVPDKPATPKPVRLILIED